jgi:hypothetical protein
VDPAVDLAVRLALAALFASAAAHKARGLAAFRAAVADYRLLPQALAPAAATALVAAEVAAALSLLVGPRAAAALAAAGLLALYGVAIAVNLARGRRDIDCGCGGPGARQTLSAGLVWRNALLGAVALTGLFPLTPRALVWIDALTMAGSTLALGALFAATSRLLAQAEALAALGRPR